MEYMLSLTTAITWLGAGRGWSTSIVATAVLSGVEVNWMTMAHRYLEGLWTGRHVWLRSTGLGERL